MNCLSQRKGDVKDFENEGHNKHNDNSTIHERNIIARSHEEDCTSAPTEDRDSPPKRVRRDDDSGG